MWAAGVDLISFFRHVAGLNIDYSKWVHYEGRCNSWRLPLHAP